MEFTDDEIRDEKRRLRLKAASEKKMAEEEFAIKKWEERVKELKKIVPTLYDVECLLGLDNSTRFKFKVIVFDDSRIRVEILHATELKYNDRVFSFMFPENRLKRFSVYFRFIIFLNNAKKMLNKNNEESKVKKVIEKLRKKFDKEVVIIKSKIKKFLSK